MLSCIQETKTLEDENYQKRHQNFANFEKEPKHSEWAPRKLKKSIHRRKRRRRSLFELPTGSQFDLLIETGKFKTFMARATRMWAVLFVESISSAERSTFCGSMKRNWFTIGPQSSKKSKNGASSRFERELLQSCWDLHCFGVLILLRLILQNNVESLMLWLDWPCSIFCTQSNIVDFQRTNSEVCNVLSKSPQNLGCTWNEAVPFVNVLSLCNFGNMVGFLHTHEGKHIKPGNQR